MALDVTKLPFNAFVGIENVDLNTGYLMKLPDKPEYQNHVQTVHAGAQFALAEASGGVLLLHRLGDLADQVFPVVRKVELKYKRPAKGELKSKGQISEEQMNQIFEDLKKKGRSLFSLKVDVVDGADQVTLQATFEWFVQMLEKAEN